MQAKDLLKPGTLSNSEFLRREVALAISNVEVAKAAGSTGQGAALGAFLYDAASKTPDAGSPTLPATQAVVANGHSLSVKNSAGAVSVTGVATVAANAVTQVVLPATTALVSTGATVAGVTGSGTTATITVANGVITGIVLS